jgi:NTE family protein
MVVMAQNNFPKIGLALGSGGARGLAHIGVIKTLEKHNIPIDYIAGSSIGAIFGAYYAANKDINQLENFILSFNRRKGFELFDFTVKGGFFKGVKAERFLAEMLGEARFDTLKIPFAAVATDINTAESLILHKGNIVKAIRASASVPAFYQPIFYKDRLLADGGLSNPVPVDVVTTMGADITIAVNLDTFYLEKTLKDLPALSKIPVHSINILRHNLARQSAKTSDVIISPRDVMNAGLLGWTFFFDNNKAKEIIKEGERAAEDSIPLIKQAIREYKFSKTHAGRLFSLFKMLRKKGRPISFSS